MISSFPFLIIMKTIVLVIDVFRFITFTQRRRRKILRYCFLRMLLAFSLSRANDSSCSAHYDLAFTIIITIIKPSVIINVTSIIVISSSPRRYRHHVTFYIIIFSIINVTTITVIPSLSQRHRHHATFYIIIFVIISFTIIVIPSSSQHYRHHYHHH